MHQDGFKKALIFIGLTGFFTFPCASTIAAPVFSNVVSGNASVTQSTSQAVTTIKQTSDKAIINWSSFNIGAKEKAQFIQPNANSVTLNRISGPASQIYGSLIANGKIILVNGAGIHFGPSAVVNVGGLIATTSDISNDHFNRGIYSFDQPSSSGGSIINEGKITVADHGLVALVGSNVTNTGMILARTGSIVLGAADKFTIDFFGDQLVNFTVDSPASSGAKIQNSGKLLANGGEILVTAAAAQTVLDSSINMDGVAEANSVKKHSGMIVLSAASGTVNVTGKVTARGNESNTTGGTIKILGQNVQVNSTANIDTSGQAGGGTILIGGNAHGTGPEQNALTTTIANGASIAADAITSGNGGNIVVWSNQLTQFAGMISAKGGSISGNGGNVEVSGGVLNYQGYVNLISAHGKTGNLLLDPTTLDVVNGGTGTIISGQNDSISTTIDPSTVNAALNSANLILNADNSITITNGISWSSGNTLTLSTNAGGSTININAPITGTNGGLIINTAGSSDAISTGSAGTINVSSFILQNGAWSQEVGQGSLSSAANLPAFSATHDFEIQGGSFLRVAGGDGSSTPYQLTDIYGLQGAAASLAQSNSYVLNNDIDASVTTNWNSGAGFVSFPGYTGTFDGQGHAISNYFSDHQGMFTQNNGTIENLNLVSPVITVNGVSESNLGGLVGWNQAIINNVNISGLVMTLNSGSISDVGGLVGRDGYYNFSTSTLYLGVVTNSSVSGTITNHNVASYGLGLAVGEINSDGQVQNVYTTGTINNFGGPNGIALLVGVNSNFFASNSIYNDYVIGTINNTDNGGGENIGGIVGFTYTSLFNSFAIVNIVNNDPTGSEQIGGIAGWEYGGPVSNSYAQGSITSNANSGYYGGISGRAYGAIQNSYAAVQLSAAGGSVGGLSGYDTNDLSTSIFDTDVAGTSAQPGSATNTGCFSGNCTNGGTLNMSSAATYSGLGWDMSSTWGIIDGESFPYLLSFYPTTPRAISGTVTNPPSNTPISGATVTLQVNNTPIATNNSATGGAISYNSVASGANGFYYFLISNGVIPDTTSGGRTPLLVSLSSGGTASTATTTPTTSGGSITGLNLVNGQTVQPNNNGGGNSGSGSSSSTTTTDSSSNDSSSTSNQTATTQFVAQVVTSGNTSAYNSNNSTNSTGYGTSSSFSSDLTSINGETLLVSPIVFQVNNNMMDILLNQQQVDLTQLMKQSYSTNCGG